MTGDDMPDPRETPLQVINRWIEMIEHPDFGTIPSKREMVRTLRIIAGEIARDESIPDPKEAAKQVYWRTCSTCGDVDRDSLEKAMRELMARCYIHAASVAREENCQFCEAEEKLERIAQGLEKGEIDR